MKNLLSIAAVIVSGIFFANTASADTPVSAETKVNVNVIFKDFVSIKVNDAQKDVKLVFETMDHYVNGVEKNQEGHLTIASTKGYTLNVKTTTPQFQGDGKQLNAHNIFVAVAPAGGSSSYGNEVALASTNAVLFNSTEARGTWVNNSIEKSFDVSYRAKGNEVINNTAIANALLGQTFTGEVVYTITTN